MDFGKTVMAYLLNCLDALMLYIIAFHMTRMKKPPLWKIVVFIMLCAFQIHFFKTTVDSRILSTAICVALNILLVMCFFGWRLTNLAAVSVNLVIALSSEGIVFFFVYLLGSDMRYAVFNYSYITDLCVILSRCMQCYLTYLFISSVRPKNMGRHIVLPRFVLLALIVVFLMLFCIYTVCMWALSNDPIPDWFLLIYICCTLLYIATTLIIIKIAVQTVRGLEERRLIDMQGAFSLELHRSLEDLKEYEHNYRKHLQTFLDLTQNGLRSDAERYYGELVSEFESAHFTVIGNMPALSAVIQRAKPNAEKNRISLETELPPTISSEVSELHLCVILSNLLENAAEACGKVKGDRRISLRITDDTPDGKLYICMENTFDISSGRPHFRRSLPITTKEDRGIHGYGLRSVRRIVDMYSGSLDISYTEEGLFIVEIIL